MAINKGARASSHPTPSHFMATLPPHTHPLHVPHKHTLAQGSLGRSSIVRPSVLSLFVCSSDRSIVRPIVRPIVHGSFVRSSDRSIVRPFVRPNNLFPTVMLPKFRSFVLNYSPLLFTDYSSSLLFIDTIHHCYYPSLLFTDTIHHHYYSSMIPIILFVVTIHRYYSSLLFIVDVHQSSDHPNFNYSSVMLSSPPKTSQTHILVI
jgi:hypothetical protein